MQLKEACSRQLDKADEEAVADAHAKQFGSAPRGRDEQQIAFNDKQKLFEDIMALKDQVAQARSETKEKIMSIGFLEKEKGMLQAQIEEYKESIKKLNAEI